MFQQDDDPKCVEWIKHATIKLLGFPKLNICEMSGLRLEATSVLENELKRTLLFNQMLAYTWIRENPKKIKF